MRLYDTCECLKCHEGQVVLRHVIKVLRGQRLNNADAIHDVKGLYAYSASFVHFLDCRSSHRYVKIAVA